MIFSIVFASSDSSDDEGEVSTQKSRALDPLLDRSMTLLDLFELFDSLASTDSFVSEALSSGNDVELSSSSSYNG